MEYLKTRVCDTPITYDGTQLSPHWIYRNFDILGNAIVAFTGPAKVELDEMVDLEDVKDSAPIYSPNMLHFIAEWFSDSFPLGIAYQHLFIRNIFELLLQKQIPNLTRKGDDVYLNHCKMTVSISTRTVNSVLMHTGINIETKGTPVATAGLEQLKIFPMEFAREVLDRFEKDFESCQIARVKVIPR